MMERSCMKYEEYRLQDRSKYDLSRHKQDKLDMWAIMKKDWLIRIEIIKEVSNHEWVLMYQLALDSFFD